MSPADQPAPPRGALERTILDAARTLFTTRGYEATRIADVAEAAGVAVGSVYRYHRDKAALLAAVHADFEQRFVDAMQAAVAGAAAHDHAARVRAVVEALFRVAAHEPHLVPMLALAPQHLGQRTGEGDGSALPGDATRAAITTMIAAGVADGTFAPVDVPITSALAHGAVEGALRRCFTVDGGGQRARYVDAVTTGLLRLVGVSDSAPARRG